MLVMALSPSPDWTNAMIFADQNFIAFNRIKRSSEAIVWKVECLYFCSLSYIIVSSSESNGLFSESCFICLHEICCVTWYCCSLGTVNCSYNLNEHLLGQPVLKIENIFSWKEHGKLQTSTLASLAAVDSIASKEWNETFDGWWLKMGSWHESVSNESKLIDI
jgi:hypothetical protein